MKKIIGLLLIFHLTILGINSVGQTRTYDPLVIENAHWEVGLWSDQNPIWAPYQIYQYVLRGDSILNGNQYKKLYYRDLDDVHPEQILTEELYGLMREDTINRKVYAITYNDSGNGCPINEEFLLYDYDLEVGDTLNMCIVPEWWGPMIIDEIVFDWQFGKLRKLYWFMYGCLIEGVGTNFGLLECGIFPKENEIASRSGFFELLNYCVGTDEECGYLWVGVEERENPYRIRIYPNPLVERKLCISIGKPINELTKIIIFDALGSEVFRTEYININSDLIIELPSGLLNTHSIFLIATQINNQPVFRQVIMNFRIKN